MRRFLAAWDAFWNAWKQWTEKSPIFIVIWSDEHLTDDRAEDIRLICTGKAHARRFPAKKGDRGFRMEGGRG
jgi:hypothetical protein